MSASQQILPTLRMPLGVMDFDLPDTLLAYRPALVQAVKQEHPFTAAPGGEKHSLALCSVLRVGAWDREHRLGRLLHTQHKQCTHIAVVLPKDVLLLTQQLRLTLKWRDHLPQGGVASCAAMCSDTAEWLLVAVGGEGWGVRAYLDGRCGRDELRLTIDSEPLGGVCAWSNCVGSFEVAVGSSNRVLLWHLELGADSIWAPARAADVCSSVVTPCSSLVHVAGTEWCVAGAAGATLIVWDSCVISEYPLTCTPLDTSVCVVYARREEGHTFVVLCMPGVCVLAVVGDGVRLLSSTCVNKLRSVSYSDGLLHMLSEDVLSVWAVGSDEPRLQWTVSGCCVADSVWTNNKHLLVLTSALHLYDFTDPTCTTH